MKRSLALSCIVIAVLSTQAQFAEMLRPAGFVENMGQVKHTDGRPASELLYRWQGDDFSIAFLRDRFVYEISYVHKDTLAAYKAAIREERRQGLARQLNRIEYIFPTGTSPRWLAEGGSQSKINYPDHKGGKPIKPMVYERLVYKNAFPNTDLVFSITAEGQCKYDIVLASGADMEAVRFDVKGLEAGTTKMVGNQLTCELPFGRFVESVPEAYTMNGSVRQIANIGYAGSARSIGFSTMDSALSAPLVIDPLGSIEWGTWFCPPYESLAWAVVAVEDDIVYVAGDCFSSALSWETDPPNPWTGLTDLWVAKFLDTDGVIDIDDLVWCNIEGGPDTESAQDLDVCGDLVAVVGYTHSFTGIATTNGGLNTDPPPVQGCGIGTESDGYLMYFDALTGAKTFGTYIGGACNDIAHTVEFDCRPLLPPRCYVGGGSLSEQIYNPGAVGSSSPFQNWPLCPFGPEHGFLQRYSLDGTMEWNTHYSGDCSTYEVLVKDLDVDQEGNVIMVSMVYDGLDPTNLGITFGSPAGGGTDLVLSSFADNGSLNWARYAGSPQWDGAQVGLFEYSNNASVVIGPSDQIYLSWYRSDNLTDLQGSLMRIANDASNPVDVWTAPLEMPSAGQGCSSSLNCMSVTCTGTLMVVGETDCQNGEFSGSHQTTFGGGVLDGYILEVEDMGSSGNILSTTYYGGTDNDWISGVSAHDPGKVYICGESASPITGGSGIAYNDNLVPNQWQTGPPTEPKAFLSRFDFGCCPATISIPDGTYASFMGITTFTGETIRVEGDWFIDQNVSLINCTVYALTGAYINVNGGAYLLLDNTDISSCQDMWKGIETQDLNSSVRMFDSSISDAEHGVELGHLTNLTGIRSDFLNNYIGVFIAKPCSACYNAVGLGLSGCLFTSNGTGLKDPFPGQLSSPGTIGYAGIMAYSSYLNITAAVPDGDNRFRNLNHGIVTADGDLTVANARFEDIHPDPAYGSDIRHGAAILSTGYKGWYYLDQVGKGTATNDPVTFTNCRWGFWVESMNFSSSANKMAGSQTLTGYHVRYCGNDRGVQIFNNDLDVQWTGVDLRFNDGASHLAVYNNNILFGVPPTAIGNVTHPAIRAFELNNTNPDSRIENNVITFRFQSEAKTAVRLNSVNQYTVQGNAVFMSNQLHNTHGINMEGCTYSRIACNSVAGQSSWASWWGPSPGAQSGIRHSMGDNNYLGCNNVTFLRQGILFNGWSPATNLQGNNFGYHDIGLLLTQNSLIGGQNHKGNIWNVPAASWHAQWVNPSTLAGNEISVNGSNPLCVPTTVSPLIGWFIPTGLPNDECSTIMPQCPANGFQGGGGERSAGMDEAVMQGTVQNGIYTDETQLTLAYELYKALYHDSTLYANGSYTADFVTMMASSVADDLRDVEMDRQELYRLAPTVLVQVQQNANSIAALRTQIVAAQAQLAAGGLSAAQIAALQGDIAGWQQSARTLDTYNETALANSDAAREVEALLLESETGLIASSELIEQNAKAVNRIYLSTVGVTGEDLTFDATQTATLLDIASQCPLVGGNPVYQARSLYSLIDDQVDFDDALICLAAGYVVKDVDADEPQVSVYPNPNRDGQLFFHLAGLDDTKEHQGIIKLYDLQGQVVTTEAITTGRAQVDVSKLAQGMYHWSIRMDGANLGQGKVTIF